MRRIAALLLAGFSVTSAYAQAPNAQTRNSQNESQANRSGAHASMANPGVDREAAIGHALSMAIDGSALWFCAQKAGSTEGKHDRKLDSHQAMRDPAGVLEQHARDAFRGSDTLFETVKQDEQQGGKPGGINRQGGAQMTKSRVCEEFYRAARDYSRALQASCSANKQAATQTSSSGSSEICTENGPKVALINHAVKEAVEGVALQMMLQHHGQRDRTTQALENHAKQMLTSGRQAIESLDDGNAHAGAGNQQDRTANVQASNAQNANNTQNQANAQNRAAGNQNPRDQQTIRREAARPNYADDRGQGGGYKEGEAVTVSQLARMGHSVIRAVEQLKQSQSQAGK